MISNTIKKIAVLTVMMTASVINAEWHYSHDGEIAYCPLGTFGAGACVSGRNPDCHNNGTSYANGLHCQCKSPPCDFNTAIRTADEIVEWKGGASGEHVACLDPTHAIAATCTTTGLGKCTIPGGDGTTYNTVIGCAKADNGSFYTDSQVDSGDTISYAARIGFNWGASQECTSGANGFIGRKWWHFMAELCSSGSQSSCRGESDNEYWGTIRCVFYY